MKSFAITAVAALVSIVAAHPSVVDDALSSAGLAGLAGDAGSASANIRLPAGIEISASTGPQAPPPSGRTNTWHPAHPGVNIDGCDAQDQEWHYVHPCEVCQEEHHTWTTSTATAVVTKTIVDCASTVADCPARITAVTTVTTSICPATNTATAPSVVNVTVTAVPSPVPTVPVPNSPVSSVEVTVIETPVPGTTAAAPPPAKSPVQVWTTAPAPAQPTRAPAPPPASLAPPVRPGNNTQVQPPVIVNGGAQAQIGLFAAVAAVAALL